MRVLITCDAFPPKTGGGTEFVTFKTAKLLKENGHEVLVVCNGDPKIREYDGIRTIRINLKKQFLANILWIPVLLKLAGKFDVIHSFTFDTSFASLIAARLKRKPVILTVQGIYGDAWIEMRGSWIRGKFRKFFEKLYLRLPVDLFHIISEYNLKLGMRMGLRRNKSIVVPWGIDWNKYKMREKKPFVLFVGRIDPQKGLIYLVEVAKKLPNIKFLIAGKGPLKEKLEKIAPKNVKFLGYVSERKKRELYSRALIFCLPSIGEGLGIVHLEAMASGCAIVSTIPFDYSGFTVEPRNVDEMATKIKYLLENKKLAIKMGKENRKRVKKYSWERILKIYNCLEKL